MNNLPETSCFRNIFSLMHFPSIENKEAPACQRDGLGKGHCRDRQDRAVTEEPLWCLHHSGSACVSNPRGNKGGFFSVFLSWE